MIIALVGMCGSGKSESASYLQSLGLKGVHFGELTLDRLRKKGLLINPSNEKTVREKIRSEHGMAGFAVLALDKISSYLEEQPLIYIDGLYSTEEYEVLEEKFPGQIILVEVFADKKVRYRRLGQRPDRPLTPEECQERDWTEIKNLNKGGPIALSDYKVNNNGNEQELYNRLDQLLEKISRPPIS